MKKILLLSLLLTCSIMAPSSYSKEDHTNENTDPQRQEEDPIDLDIEETEGENSYYLNFTYNNNNKNKVYIKNKLYSKNLKELYLNNEKIMDMNIWFLKDIKNLEVLDLAGNLITRIKPLENLKQLKILDLRGNRITSIEPLENLEKLQILDLRGNDIPDDDTSRRVIDTLRRNNPNIWISGVDHIQGRELQRPPVNEKIVAPKAIDDTVTINGNRYSTKLKELDLSGNQIDDIRSLKDIKNLEVLYLAGSLITSIKPLENLKQLKILDLRGNRITSIEPLENLEKLQILELTGNDIPDDDTSRRVIDKLRQRNPNIWISGVDHIKRESDDYDTHSSSRTRDGSTSRSYGDLSNEALSPDIDGLGLDGSEVDIF